MPRPPTRREPSFTEADTRGYVYVITNPAWPDHVKIGCAGDCNKRLSQFNTGSPRRDYAMPFHVYSSNRVRAERLVHSRLRDQRAAGEWFQLSVWAAVEELCAVGESDPSTSEEIA